MTMMMVVASFWANFYIGTLDVQVGWDVISHDISNGSGDICTGFSSTTYSLIEFCTSIRPL